MEKAVRALLLTDVVDSTKLVESLGKERAADLWAAHDTAARKLLPARGGLEIDKTDGFLLLFESAADAAGYALAYHRALRDLSKELGVELAARAGLHVGEVVLRENPADEVALGAKPLEVEGLAKPTAARIMSLAVAHQTLLSGSARAALGDELPGETDLQSHGVWRLKGVLEPLQLHELGVRGESPFTPPPDAGKVYRVVERDGLWLPARDLPRSLPAEPDGFVGREAELQELAHRFDAGARLLTVLGPGGTGKTRLVTRHAWTWLGDYPGGAWFCDLSDARSLDGIARALATTLDVPLGQDDPLVQLGHAIAGRGECLIVFDNFEQVAEHAGATVGKWLERAPGAHFVVTSRVLLNLHAEAVMHVEPLAVDGAAIELFELRARAKKPGFAVTVDNRAHVEKLVDMLDGLPLAIELAAARVRVMSPAKLVARMSDRFALLSGARGARHRQATLEAAIDWSWDLLEPWEKAALAQSSVFAGGFTLEAAEAVLDLSLWDDAPWPLDAVQALVDKSLLRTWTPEKAGQRHDIDEPYFGMYVSIHEYAAAKLRTAAAIEGGASGPAAERAAHERHGEHFAALGTAEALEALDTHGGVLRRRALAGELENVVLACRRAVTRGDGATAVPTLHAAWEVLRSEGPHALAAELARSVVALPELAPDERARARMALGNGLCACGGMEEARACYEDALATARELGDRRTEAHVLDNLGLLERGLSRQEEARACFEAALAIARELGDRRTEGLVLGNLGTSQLVPSRQQEARACLEDALAMHREVGNRRSEGDVVANIGALHVHQGRMEEARACFEDALVIHREVRNRRSEGIVVGNLGLILQVQGPMEEARARYEDALAIVREVGYRHAEGAFVGRLGGLYLNQGRLEEARACFEDAFAIAREVGDRAGQCMAVGDLGTFHSAQGRMEQARACHEDALAIAREVKSREAEGVQLALLGKLHLAQGRLEEARPCLEAGEALLRQSSNSVALGKLLCFRGRLEQRTGELAAAHATLAEAESLAAEVGAGPHSELGLEIVKLREEVGDADTDGSAAGES